MTPVAIAFVLAALLALSVPSLAEIPGWQKVEILKVFNQARRTTVLPAADMKILQWDEGLAQQAQAFTDQCERVWRPLNNAWFAYWDRMPNPVAVAKWRTWRMAPYYDYQTGGCINTPKSNATCRHPDNYEAIVTAESERVGCGMTTCWPAEGPKANFHACVIGGRQPPRSKKAWKLGPPCSACPTGWNYCLEGLCSKVPATGKPSQSPVTSVPSRTPTKFPTKAPTRYPTLKPTAAPRPTPVRTKAPTRRRRRG